MWKTNSSCCGDSFGPKPLIWKWALAIVSWLWKYARYVRQVYAVDVSDTITDGVRPPANFHLALSDGCSIPVPQGSVDIAYSNQLMEHLHPEDAEEQLRNIHQALAPGGQYLCITPNRLSGPHDISWLFDREATGFHLREYTVRDLRELFFQVGFSSVKVYIGGRGFYSQVPSLPILVGETMLSCLPFPIRRVVTNGRLAMRAARHSYRRREVNATKYRLKVFGDGWGGWERPKPATDSLFDRRARRGGRGGGRGSCRAVRIVMRQPGTARQEPRPPIPGGLAVSGQGRLGFADRPAPIRSRPYESAWWDWHSQCGPSD